MTLSLILSKPLPLIWFLRSLTIKNTHKSSERKKETGYADSEPGDIRFIFSDVLVPDSRGTLIRALPKIKTKVL